MKSIDTVSGDNQSHEQLNNPEIVDHEARVLELLQPSPELEERLRVQLDAVIDQAQSTSINTQVATTIHYTGEIIKWELFGRIGEPLPPGLIYSDGYYEGYQSDIVCDGRNHFCYNCKRETTDRFNELGLQDIVEEIQQDIRSRELPILEAIRSTIKETTTYRLVQSLQITPPPINNQRPLSRIELQSRQQANYYDTLKKYTTSHIDPMSAAARELWKLNMALEDMTVPGKAEAPEINAYERVYAYFLSPLQKALPSEDDAVNYIHDILPPADEELEDAEAIVKYSTSPDKSAPMEQTFISNLTGDIAIDVTRENYGNVRHLRYVAEWYFTHNFLTRLYSSTTEDLDAIVEAAIEETTSYIYDGCQQPLGGSFYSDEEYFQGYSRRSPGEFEHAYNIRTKAHEKWHEMSPRAFGFNISNSEKEKVGNIIKYNEALPDTHRIILTQAFNADLPYSHPCEDLIVTLSNEYFGREQDPFVPGFILTSRDGQRYGFVYDPTADPYTPPDHQLTSDQLQQMKAMYTAVNLTGLASQMGESITSIQSWVNGLRDTTIYPDLQTDGQNYGLGAEWNTLQDFEPFIIDDRLYAQCTGSGRFFQLSFETIFGEGTADHIGGLLLTPEITSAGHAQVVITLNNRLHIVDTTVTSDSSQDEQAPSETAQTPESRISLPPPPTPPEVIPTRYLESSDVDTPEFYQDQLLIINSNLETHLQNILGAKNNDDLFEVIAALPSHDPIRRTLSQVRRATRQEESCDGLTENLAYLNNYRRADSSLRQKIGLADYDTELVGSLQSSIKHLMVIAERAPELFASHTRPQ